MTVTKKMALLSSRVDEKVAESTEWIGDHLQPRYVDAVNCEKCFLGGMAFILSELNGTTQEEEYQAMMSRVPKPSSKKKVVRRRGSTAAKKRVVVRRKK